jgi:hypothetical protein
LLREGPRAPLPPLPRRHLPHMASPLLPACHDACPPPDLRRRRQRCGPPLHPIPDWRHRTRFVRLQLEEAIGGAIAQMSEPE